MEYDTLSFGMESIGANERVSEHYERARPESLGGLFVDKFQVEIGSFDSEEAALGGFSQYADGLPKGIAHYWPDNEFHELSSIHEFSGGTQLLSEGMVENRTGKYQYSWMIIQSGRYLIHTYGLSSWTYTSAEVSFLSNLTSMSLQTRTGELQDLLPKQKDLIIGMSVIEI